MFVHLLVRDMVARLNRKPADARTEPPSAPARTAPVAGRDGKAAGERAD